MGGVGNGATEEDSHWDLNPGAAAMLGWGHTALARKVRTIRLLAKKGEPLGFGVPFAMQLRKPESKT